MTIPNILNIIGLILNIIGVLMLYKYGIPQMIDRSGAIFLICEKESEESKSNAKKYDKCSHIALAFIIVGFFFQLLSYFPFIVNILSVCQN